jgi:hypothetical protein
MIETGTKSYKKIKITSTFSQEMSICKGRFDDAALNYFPFCIILLNPNKKSSFNNGLIQM